MKHNECSKLTLPALGNTDEIGVMVRHDVVKFKARSFVLTF